MEKYIKDGKVGVLVSTGWGTGWSTWGCDDLRDQLAMDSRFVQAKLDGWDEHKVEELAERVFGEDAYVCCDSWSETEVYWISVGEKFLITEHDGHESLMTIDCLTMTA